MKYRDHRGSLDKSMETVREINSVQELIEHLNQYYNQFGKTVAEIKFRYYGYDHRIKWDTYLVLFRLDGEKTFSVAGMSDKALD